jgi:RNA polymerase sigma factor (sigma-70 family)
MSRPGTSPANGSQQELLQAARHGDQDAFAQLVGRHDAELRAHCYRMLGSVPDAEDALQEALLRAWRGLPRFEGRSSLHSWLYAIATNACLRAIERRPKRVLPIDYGPASDPHDGPDKPLLESVWVEPYPDELLGLSDGAAAPEARYEQRESVELAFVAALQNLPARQRAVLILRDVLGFSAAEVAETLETTTASVNSALQRARKMVDERLPAQSQQATLRSLGDTRLRGLVDDYLDAWERGDVDGEPLAPRPGPRERPARVRQLPRGQAERRLRRTRRRRADAARHADRADHRLPRARGVRPFRPARPASAWSCGGATRGARPRRRTVGGRWSNATCSCPWTPGNRRSPAPSPASSS